MITLSDWLEETAGRAANMDDYESCAELTTLANQNQMMDAITNEKNPTEI
jgi:hypothetical protein